MTADKVRWGVTFLDPGRGVRRRSYPTGGRVRFESFTSRYKALLRAVDFVDECEARIIKLTRKPRAKVVAKWRNAGYNGGDIGEGSPADLWLKARVGKKVRITLEELDQ